jgi:SAM-dependent methyltransferase
MDEPGKIYNDLLKFESRSKKKEPYPIHKKLRFSNLSDDLISWFTTEISFTDEDYVLDAGCGTGYTLFKLHQRFKIKGIGISQSSREIKYAQNACSSKKLQRYLDFKLEDYQMHSNGPYSKIICIESLKHANDLNKTLNNLMDHMAINATMIIVDDFATAESKAFNRHKKLWHAPGFTSIENYQEIIDAKKTIQYRIIDLTRFVPVRPDWKLNILYFLVSIMRPILIGVSIRNVNTYLGGLLLEKLYSNKQVKYLAIIIEHKTS